MSGTTHAFSDAKNDGETQSPAMTESARGTAESRTDEAATPDPGAYHQTPNTRVMDARLEDIAPYWVERKRYLKRIRKIPELRQRFGSAVFVYLLRRLLWSFGFFPLFIAFWLPFVFASFNPVIMVNDILPDLQAFVAANPEVQANMLQTLVIAWLSVGFSFVIFDLVLTPFRSPYEYEADVHMRAWEHHHASSEERPAADDGPGRPIASAPAGKV